MEGREMNLLAWYLLGMFITYIFFQGNDIASYVRYVRRGGNFKESRMDELRKGVGRNLVGSLFWPFTVPGALLYYLVIFCEDMVEKLAKRLEK
jgi:hypothetical protein